MIQDAWVTRHPYLQPVASLEAQVNNEMGILRFSAVAIDCLPAEKMIRSKVERLTASPMPQMADEIRIVEGELGGELPAPHRVVDLLRELVGSRDEVTGIPTSAMNSPESVRGIRIILLPAGFFAGGLPKVRLSLAETVTAGAQREESHNSAGLGHPLWRLRDKNNRHALAVMLDPLDAIGKELS
jgi:hypothetical protein